MVIPIIVVTTMFINVVGAEENSVNVAIVPVTTVIKKTVFGIVTIMVMNLGRQIAHEKQECIGRQEWFSVCRCNSEKRKMHVLTNRKEEKNMYNNLDDLVNSFCYSCRNKRVNSNTTVEKQIRDAFQCVFRNNVAGGYFLLAGAMATLQAERGCHTCMSTLQTLMDNFQG